MFVKLKKCPFCGATAVISKREGMYELWAGHSDDCYLKWFKYPKSFSRDDLAEKWNMRKGEDNDTERTN